MAKKKTSVTIKLSDTADGGIETVVTFDPPCTRKKASRAQEWGYQIVEAIQRAAASGDSLATTVVSRSRRA